MIVVIDYGLGNVRSIYAKIEQMGENVKISHEISDIECAEKIIIPGVGSFDAGMKKLHDLNIVEMLNKKVIHEKIPILGICLGMQLFTQRSEEGRVSGLSYIDAETKKFSFYPLQQQNIPHMGWNTISIGKQSPILHNIDNGSRFYFVHSYHVVCNEPDITTAVTYYGYNFPSIIQKDNIIGVQFHPEKSHRQGIQLLRNFVRH
jgi:glutamine amidotransferase